MIRYGLFVGVLVLLLANGTGCGLHRCLVPCCGCGTSHGCAQCDNGCGSTCGVANDPMMGGCKNNCGCGGCGGCGCQSPFEWLRMRLTCCSGCGNQCYYGEWISDPPACCDPCDNCGNFIGPQCGGAGGKHGGGYSGGGCGGGGCGCGGGGGRPIGPLLAHMWWGYPYPGSCCGSSCSGGGPGNVNYELGPNGTVGRPVSNGPSAVAPRGPASDENLAPENVVPGRNVPPPSSGVPSLEPKAARPTPATRASYQRPGMGTRQGMGVRPGYYQGPQQYQGQQQYRQYPQQQ
jgi:hypothetical protein